MNSSKKAQFKKMEITVKGCDLTGKSSTLGIVSFDLAQYINTRSSKVSFDLTKTKLKGASFSCLLTILPSDEMKEDL